MNNGLFGIQGRAGVASSGGGITVPIGGVLDMAVGTNLPSTLTVDGQKFIQSGSTVQYDDELKSLVDLGIGSTLNQQLVGGFPQGGGTKVLVYNTNTDLVEFWCWVAQLNNANSAKLYGPDTATNPTSFEVTLKAEFDVGGWACMWIGYSYGTKKTYCLAKGVSLGSWDGAQISYPVQLFSSADGFTWIKESFTALGNASNWFSGSTTCVITDVYLSIEFNQSGIRYITIYSLIDFTIALSASPSSYTKYSMIPVKEGFIHSYNISGTSHHIFYYKGNAMGDNMVSYTLYSSSTAFYHNTPVVYAKGIFLCYEYVALGSTYVWKYTRNPVGAIATSPEWTAVTGGPTANYIFAITLEDNSYSKIYMSQTSTTAYQSSDYGVTWSSYTPVTTAAFSLANQMFASATYSILPISRGFIGNQSGGYHLDYDMLSIDGANASSPGFFQTILYLSGYYYGFTSGISSSYDSGQVFRSTDLHDWKMVFSCPAKFVNAKILNGNLVGFHGTSRITYSSNGTSWTSGNLNVTTVNIVDGEFYNAAGTYKYVFVGDQNNNTANVVRLNSTTLALTGWAATVFKATNASLRSITLGSSSTAFVTIDTSAGDSSGMYNFATDAFTASTTQLQYINYWNTSYPNRAVWCGNKWVMLVGTGPSFKMYYTTDGVTLTQVSQQYVGGTIHLEYNSTDNVLCGVSSNFTMRKWTSVSTADFSVFTDTPLMIENNVSSVPIINFVNNKTLATQYIKSTYPGSALTVMDVNGGSTYFTIPPIEDTASTIKYVRYK